MSDLVSDVFMDFHCASKQADHRFYTESGYQEFEVLKNVLTLEMHKDYILFMS